ncbi:MJ1255/VC2487 family glycosyltransferase [Thalassotalea ganghwensis]
MKILYGIQATGNGHISRGRVMAKYLAEHQFDVTYLFSGRARDKLFEMEVFGDYLWREGLTFVTNYGQINYLKTALGNNIFKFINDIYQLDIERYDLVITDFEPITAWAAKRASKPSLAIGHQYAFGEDTPMTGESWLAKSIMRYFAPAQQSIGLHWAKFNNNVMPPIVDVELRAADTRDIVLVYLPFENQQKVTSILKQFSHHQFVQYSPDLDNDQQGNVALRKTCLKGFKRDLSSANGVICNSGFELNSECMHLGVPILTKPIKGQMEQESNALALSTLGLGQTMLTLDEKIIDNWLSEKALLKSTPMPDVAKTIVEWLASERKAPLEQVVDSLWFK